MMLRGKKPDTEESLLHESMMKLKNWQKESMMLRSKDGGYPWVGALKRNRNRLVSGGLNISMT